MGTAAGLGFGVNGSWHNPAEVIPWSELEKHSCAQSQTLERGTAHLRLADFHGNELPPSASPGVDQSPVHGEGDGVDVLRLVADREQRGVGDVIRTA